MSVKLMSAIFETEFRDLQDEKGDITKASTAKLVLLALADHANDEGESAYPSVERLARKTALSPQTIRNTFDALKYNGVVFLNGISKYRTNNYTINTASFPRITGEKDTILTLNPLEAQMGNVSPSNQSLLTLNPLEPNHHINIKEPDMLDAILESERQSQPIKEACIAFEATFGVITWPWDINATWRKFAKWVTVEYQRDNSAFNDYVTWRGGDGKYQAMSNNKIRQNPQMFMDTGWPTFLAHSSMYPADDNRPHPEFEKIKAPEGVKYAPPPPKIKLPR